jgi:hypothetical protein
MKLQSQSLITRVTLASLAATLGITLFLTGVWAGSARGGGELSLTVPTRGHYWNYDPETGNPTGPQGQLDFWNYDPATGEKISNSSPGVAPEALATLWSGSP